MASTCRWLKKMKRWIQKEWRGLHCVTKGLIADNPVKLKGINIYDLGGYLLR